MVLLLTYAKTTSNVGSIGTATDELEIKTSGSRYLELQDIVGLYNSAWTGNLQNDPNSIKCRFRQYKHSMDITSDASLAVLTLMVRQEITSTSLALI